MGETETAAIVEITKTEKDVQSETEPSGLITPRISPRASIVLEKEAHVFEQHARQVFLEPEEDNDELEQKASRSSYPVLGIDDFAQEKKKTVLRRSQAIVHLSYTDLRIESLEKQIKVLRKAIKGLPEDFEVADATKGPTYKCELKRSIAQDFQLTEDSHSIPFHSRPVLEALLVDHGATGRVRSKDTADSSESLTVPENVTVERLRIRSKPLLRHLARVTGQNSFAKSTGYEDELRKPSAVVIVRPFKSLVVFEKEIRQSLVNLETKRAQETDSKSESQGTRPDTETVDSKDKNDVEPSKEKSEVNETTSPERVNQDSQKQPVQHNNEDLIAELKLLIEFMDTDLKPTFDLRQQIKDGSLKDIEFADLWHLFERGEDVITPQSGVSERLTAYRVLNTTGGRDPLCQTMEINTKPTPVDGFAVDAFNLSFNGTELGPKLEHFSIRRYQGARPVRFLPVFPLRFSADFAKIKKSLDEQGERFLNLTKFSYAHMTLVGTTLDEPAEEVDAQVIVDMALAVNKNPEWHVDLAFDETQLTTPDDREVNLPPFCKHGDAGSGSREGCCGSDMIENDLQTDRNLLSDYLRDHGHHLRPFPVSELVEDENILLPDWIYGFVLRSRQWVTMNIKDLSEVQYRNSFDSLVLPKGHSDTVRALVRNHARDSLSDAIATSKLGAAIELVRGKGKGLIILLHGEPGVGKTSTAECVADLTKRPLFPVTCGDIGETAADVQKNLDSSFQLAHKWGCVLLLDEADVFMAKRNKTDLRRNAVVSIFLRTLEYYSGILFLTTNRVGSIDPAFKSRIHVSLFYPKLDLDATIQLFQLLIDRTISEQKQAKKQDFSIKSKEIIRFAKAEYKSLSKEGLATWNGRQIRNAFQTAITLAEYQARQSDLSITTLGKEQFMIVAEASKDFDLYMKETLGAADAEVARREQVRYDSHGNVLKGSTHTRNVKRSTESDYTKRSRESARRPELDTSDSESSEVSESSEDESEDEDLPASKNVSKGKGKETAVPASSGSRKSKKTESDSKEKDDEIEKAEFREYLKFKKLQEGRGKGN